MKKNRFIKHKNGTLHLLFKSFSNWTWNRNRCSDIKFFKTIEKECLIKSFGNWAWNRNKCSIINFHFPIYPSTHLHHIIIERNVQSKALVIGLGIGISVVI
ncbi:hypothetical protein Glove_172g34 [Diversispora epigaea]|uniref:Uncharacterized protein n=1 Tax=Diversispora epigaea TaxID=1348612 RepID=A0A397IU23_9GLOM|nr:hypothetical protein Glove_172g34 [Diversispora epigaea]